MPLLETDALTIRSTFDSLPEEAKPLASDWLRRYKDQQDEFGLPLFPSEVETQQADESAFVSMFDDVKLVDPGNGIYDQAERLKSGEGDRLRRREAGMRFLANQYGDEEKVRRDFPLYRDDYAMQNGGKRDMGDGEFYSFVSQQVKRQQGQKLVRSRSLDAGFRAAIEGMGSLEKLAAVKSQAAANADSEVDAGAFLEAYGETQKVMSKHAAFIRETVQAVSTEMDGGDIDLEPLKERLLDMPGTERRIVLAALRMEADKAGEKIKGEKGGKFDLFAGKFLQQTGEAAGRLARSAVIDQPRIERLIASIPDTGEVMAPGAIKTAKDAQAYVREALMRSDVAEASAMASDPGGVGGMPVDDNRSTITLDDNAQRLIQDAKEREMKRLRVANEIRSIGEAADPIPNVFASTIGTSGAALALMAGTRGLAAPALANAYTNIEFNDLSLKYPQMSTADKTFISGISAATQTALDYVGVKALDKLPGIKSLIAQPLTKQLAGRALARGAMSFGQENFVEAGQDIATPALMQALKSDVPGFDWEAEQREFWKGRADVAIGLLPLTLLGIGAASVNEYRGAKNLLSWNDQLGAAGVVETDRVAVIEAAQSGDMGKAQSILMEAWGRRNPEVAAEYQDAMSQRQTDMSRATAELERLGAIPTLRRDGDGWTVTSNGASTKFATWEEARDVATAAMGDMERAQTELVASLSDSFMASTPAFLKGESVEFNTNSKGESLVDRVNAGAMTPEQAMEAAVAGGVIKGVTMQEARAIAAEVFGGQNASERAMQFRQDVEKIAVLGRNTVQNGQSRSIVNAAGNERSFLTVVEEVVEGRWKGGLERRAFTKEQGVRWVQLAEAATGEKFLEGSTWDEIAASAELAPRALTEAISRIVVADVLGRMKDGKRIGPGTVSSGLNLNDREQSALAAILDAFRKLFRALLETASKLAKARQEGKLGGEYDALFDALTGGSSQLEHDAGAAKEAESIASEAVDTSGYSPENPGPNGETFSTSRAVPTDASKVVQMPDGAQLVGPTTFSIRAYHGTPHKVDRFRTDKIGTGEGAQAYGYGLYFAESDEVARQYQKTLSLGSIRYDGQPYDNSNPRHVAASMVAADGESKAIERAQALLEIDGSGPRGRLLRAVIKSIRDNDIANREQTNTGNLYTVELLPDESEFLDWDKPLSEQSEKVKAAISKWTEAFDSTTTAGQWYADMTDLDPERPGTQAKIFSQKLSALGIPGIKYLDAGSRGTGDGTRNFVIFDENLVRILEENGKPVETFSLGKVTPAQDAEYMAAVEAGDMVKAQRMVDEAAKAAGYNVGPVYHAGKVSDRFDKSKIGTGRGDANLGRGFYFHEDKDVVEGVYGEEGPIKAFYIKARNPLDVQSGGGNARFEQTEKDGYDSARRVVFDKDEETGKVDIVPLGEWVVWNPEQAKSADPVTRDESGEIVPLSQRFNPTDNRITFSLRPGDFAARMEAKFSLFQAKPELRLAIAQVAKERVLQQSVKINEAIAKQDAATRALQEAETAFAEEMASLRADYEADEKAIRDERDTELKGVAADKGTELDRERIRRDADKKLARVRLEYERNQKEIEAKKAANDAKLNKSETAADREALKAIVRALDGALAVVPPVVRASVGGYFQAAKITTSAGMLKWAETRIDKLNVELEKYLKKQAVAEISKLFKKARPDMEAGKKGKGKDADMHALFAAAEAAADMDALAVAGRLADLDARIASGELTSEQEALAMTERGIVELVGDLKNADSGRAFSALDTLRDIYGGAWLKWKIAEIERKERRAGLRQDFIEATGKAGVRTERTKADKVNESLFGKGKAWLLNLSSMREVLAYAFGLDNERVTSLVDAERTASNTYEDANQRLGDEIEGLFTAMAGTRTKGERLRWNLSQRTIKTGKGELSQLEAIQALLMWRQEDGRRHMEGTRDESGKVTSSWSYDQAWIDEIEAALTPEARQVMSFIMGKYAAEWATLNPLYRARYGVNMPHHDAYAPITVTPVQTKAGEVVDPVTGSAVSGGSILTPGSLRTRSRNAIAEPDFRDALQTMILHSRQMEYWKAYYDLAVEMNAVLGNREVMNSVHAKGGKEAANALRQWIDVIGQGGFRDASLRLALFQAGSKLQGRAAGVALLGRMSAILSQSTQLAAASVKMPVTSYLVRLAKLMTGGLGWRDAMRSDFIQRRFKTAPPIVRQAMDSLASAKPNEIQGLSRFFGNVLSGADAFFTSGTYAILLDYHREQGRAAGLSGAELDAYAHTEAERATEQVAQPTRRANRSLAELSNTGPLGKIGWAFASEARQKVALVAHASLNAKNDPVTAAKSAFLTFAIGGLFTQVLKNLLREAKGDDDREMWSLGRLGYAITVAPLASAIPFGSAIAGDSNMLSNIQRAIQTLGNDEVDFRDVDAMLSAAGLFNDTAASLAQLSHLGLDLGKILANAAD